MGELHNWGGKYLTSHNYSCWFVLTLARSSMLSGNVLGNNSWSQCWKT